MTERVHFQHPTQSLQLPICRKTRTASVERYQVTADPKAVTCPRCVKKLHGPVGGRQRDLAKIDKLRTIEKDDDGKCAVPRCRNPSVVTIPPPYGPLCEGHNADRLAAAEARAVAAHAAAGKPARWRYRISGPKLNGGT